MPSGWATLLGAFSDDGPFHPSGVVYRAFDRERDAVVALKALRRTEPEAFCRFKREFRSLTDLTHPNLISLYELFCEEDQWFFTMELVEGVSFSDYVRAEPGDGTGLETTTPTVALPVVREPEAARTGGSHAA